MPRTLLGVIIEPTRIGVGIGFVGDFGVGVALLFSVPFTDPEDGVPFEFRTSLR